MAQPELFAMTCELWAPAGAPLLVLNSTRGSYATQRPLASVDVVRSLRLDRLNRKWMVRANMTFLDQISSNLYSLQVQSCDVESLNGVRSGMRWLLGEI